LKEFCNTSQRKLNLQRSSGLEQNFSGIDQKQTFDTNHEGRMSTQEFDGTDPNAGLAQDDVAASVESLETDLDDVIDPYRLEVPLAIDDQGHFLAWMDAESRVVPLPSDEARATHDLSDFSTEITQDGFKRFTPKAIDAGEPTAFHPTSAAIDAVFAELEASAKDYVEPVHEPAPAFEVEAHAETGFSNQTELETDTNRSEIDPLALEDSFEQVPFDAPALIGEQPLMLEVEAPVEVQAEVQVESEVRASMNPAASEFGLENTELEAMLAAISSATESEDTTVENLLEQDRMAVYEMEGVPVTNLSKQLEHHLLEIESASAPSLKPAIAHTDKTTQTINLPMLPATTIMRRHFDATDLIEAQIRLRQALRPLEVSVLALLARAAERCSLELPGIKSIVLAELAEHGVTVTAEIKAVESFREMLAGIAEGSSGVTADLCVLDIRDLGFSETILRLAGLHLLLTHLSPHPEKPGRLRGTISLCGLEDSQVGASFLNQVVSKLEAPITLMV
jgi:hypothetical protein